MMKVLTAEQIRACDEYTIQHEPIASINLMERASIQLAEWIKKRYNKNESFVLFAGPGNNGGDALSLARLLLKRGFENVKVCFLQITQRISPDCKINLDRLQQLDSIGFQVVYLHDDMPTLSANDIVVDGIFGSGLSRMVDGYWGDLIYHINQSATDIIAIDIPSGLFCEDNSDNNGAIIEANYTLSFQVPKQAFFFAENEGYVGEWKVLDIELHPKILEDTKSSMELSEKGDVHRLLKSRRKFDHKGTFGHAFLIAGSYQKTGAAILAAKACMRSGVGLLTAHIPQSAYEIMQTTVPEAMVCIDETEMKYCSNESLQKYKAIGVGPGIGQKSSVQNALLQVHKNASVPIVLDADAINILANNKDWLNDLPKYSILTPHPGEFDRLTKKHELGYDRLQTQIKWSVQYQVIIVLKGAYTSITSPDGMVHFNPTGNPGMATAGSGDVLTGIILSLLAQGYLSMDAALLGTFIHGLAGDIAAQEKEYESLIASDIIDKLPEAFKVLKYKQ